MTIISNQGFSLTDSINSFQDKSFKQNSIPDGVIVEQTPSIAVHTKQIVETINKSFERNGANSKPIADAKWLKDKQSSYEDILAKVNQLPMTELSDIQIKVKGILKELKNGYRIESGTGVAKGDATKILKNFKSLEKQLKTSKPKQKNETANMRFVETTLAIDEVAKARFSHSTIAPKTAQHKISLGDLQETIKNHGWKPGAPRIMLYRMPDGSLTSYDNRRLYVIKNINNETENNKIENASNELLRKIKHIPVLIYDIDSKVSAREIGHMQKELYHDIEREEKNDITPPDAIKEVRKALLEPSNNPTVFSAENTRLHHILLRIYRDAGKPHAQERAVYGKGDYEGMIFGYSSVSVREEIGNEN